MESFAKFVEKYVHSVYNFVFFIVKDESDAADITQETFIKAWQHFNEYYSTKSFKSWILMIAKNTAFDFLKKKKEIPFSDFSTDENDELFEETIADSEKNPEELLIEQEEAARLNTLLQMLPDSQRMVVVLHIHEGMTFNEVAELLDESLNTVKSRYHRGILRLRELFQEK